jgi:hypothetical protein
MGVRSELRRLSRVFGLETGWALRSGVLSCGENRWYSQRNSLARVWRCEGDGRALGIAKAVPGFRVGDGLGVAEWGGGLRGKPLPGFSGWRRVAGNTAHDLRMA